MKYVREKMFTPDEWEAYINGERIVRWRSAFLGKMGWLEVYNMKPGPDWIRRTGNVELINTRTGQVLTGDL
jgi:hypothetical protein